MADTEVGALTSVLEDASVVCAVRTGAIGYLFLMTPAPEKLRQAIKGAPLARGMANTEIGRELGITE